MSAEATPAVARAAVAIDAMWRVHVVAGTEDRPEYFAGEFARAALAAALDDEEVTAVLAVHGIECTGLGEATCRACRDAGWMSWHAFRKHQAAALRAAILGGAS